jgi:hypothetical protein
MSSSFHCVHFSVIAFLLAMCWVLTTVSLLSAREALMSTAVATTHITVRTVLIHGAEFSTETYHIRIKFRAQGYSAGFAILQEAGLHWWYIREPQAGDCTDQRPQEGGQSTQRHY